MTSLVAVLVTYNRLEHLKVAIAALRGQQCMAVVVVDNCSTDGSREWLSSEAPALLKNLDVVLADKNLGGAGGFELGFRRALEYHDSQWIVCFDDDAFPHEGAFEAFLESDLGGLDAAAAAVYLPTGEISEMNRPSRNPFWHLREFFGAFWGGRQGFHLADADYASQEPIAIDATSFVGFFIRAEFVRKIGLPDGRLFIYGDDVLYTLRVSRAGGRIGFLPWVRFGHDCSTFSDSVRTYTPLWKAYYTYRNSIHVYRVAAGPLFWFVFPLRLMSWLAASRHYSRPKIYLRVTWAAVKDALSGRFQRTHEEVVALASDATD